jgi:hypothetical protein
MSIEALRQAFKDGCRHNACAMYDEAEVESEASERFPTPAIAPEDRSTQVYPRLTPRGSRLLAAFDNAAFACGEWSQDDDEPFVAVYRRSRRAQKALLDYFVELEARTP